MAYLLKALYHYCRWLTQTHSHPVWMGVVDYVGTVVAGFTFPPTVFNDIIPFHRLPLYSATHDIIINSQCIGAA